MNSPPETARASGTADTNRGVLARLAQIAAVFAVQAAALFAGAGDTAWTWGWVLLAICLASVVANASFMFKINPETIAERGRPSGANNRDKVMGVLWSVFLFLVLPLTAGLDVRHGWTGEVAPGWHIAGVALVVVGLGLGGWAMITNTFFSTAVRIQTDRGQTVCREGPYHFVRHPGYLGFILQSVGTPLLLGSSWAMIPGIAACAMMIVRTQIEDRMLLDELQGYRKFSHEVRSRLFPGIW